LRASSPDQRPPKPASRIGRWVREPLLQFVLIGLVLFGVQRWLHPDVGAVTAANRIEVTQDDLRQMSVTWLAQGRPPLTAEEWRNLIDAKVREEVLYREALAAGLDQGDTIVKRRMVQKMEFLAEDVATAHEPTDAELKAWFDANQARFAVPPRITFRHLYFGFDQRGQRAKDDAQSALTAIGNLPEDSKVALAMGDPFMFQDVYRDRIPDHIAKELGPPFAHALFQLTPGAWRGPIESGYGWHLVFVESLEPERLAAYEEVEADVRTQWVAEQSEQAKRKAYEQMRAKYIVILPEPPQ
jgi:peptidyl-prolyl cis-trans isomerase C